MSPFRRCLVPVLLVVLSLGALGETPEEFVERWAAELNKNDAESFLELYDQSENTEIIVSAGLQYRGIEEIGKTYRSDFKQVRFSESKALKTHSRMLGETAIVSFEHRLRIRGAGDKRQFQVHIRTTSVLRRVDGKWLIAMEHSSPIKGVERLKEIKE